jgi:hypothetical protein
VPGESASLDALLELASPLRRHVEVEGQEVNRVPAGRETLQVRDDLTMYQRIVKREIADV